MNIQEKFKTYCIIENAITRNDIKLICEILSKNKDVDPWYNNYKFIYDCLIYERLDILDIFIKIKDFNLDNILCHIDSTDMLFYMLFNKKNETDIVKYKNTLIKRYKSIKK